MLAAKRLLGTSAAATPRLAVRAFGSTPAAQNNNKRNDDDGRKAHVPTLADIEPDNQDAFNSKQKAFRERLAEAQKVQESSAFPSSSSSRVSVKPLDSNSANLQGLGSLSTAKGSAEEIAKSLPSRRSGPIANLIYGTKEGRELDAQIEASFSQVLARGKYVHSIQLHEVKPDKVEEYVDLVGTWYPRIANNPENKVHLVGSWRTEVGDCDTFVHIWEYQRYEGYHTSLNAVSSHPEYPEFDRKLRTLVNAKRSSLMQEFSFWPTTPPRQLGGLFELRSYTLHPGNLLEWESHWRRGLKARREVMEGVGAWFVQIGELNTVHHLWQFANLEERKIRREQSWSIEGWSDTVHKTVPLIQSMKSRILVPLPWSPVA
ncbi:nipsnap family protein [Niveomyces insectorum RCEF 264]|uniref:Nipsnap family protein n=1 Tax=Niveomyces insectorum RCEF 264 TaxID=1081102 RepID=A0A167T654_9HYPO|nr:nipsnap family protein [Niveomyces insectorum RCEF 264]